MIVSVGDAIREKIASTMKFATMDERGTNENDEFEAGIHQMEIATTINLPGNGTTDTIK